MLPALERQHDVLAPTLPGHAGGPAIEAEISEAVLADAVERAMDEAGFETAHVVGNSLGGYVALQLAARGRALSVVALAPAGGWAQEDDSPKDTLAYFTTMHELLKAAAPHRRALPHRLAAARRLGRAPRRRALPPARRPARDRAADPRLHGALTRASYSSRSPSKVCSIDWKLSVHDSVASGPSPEVL